MDRKKLEDHIDFVQARIEEVDKRIINLNPDDKGYKESVDSYNKWIDRYHELLEKLEHLDDVDVEVRKLELEEEKQKAMEQIEQDKLNLAQEQLRLDREKFAHDVQDQKDKEIIEVVLRSADIGVKVLVPTLTLAGMISLAKFAYMNDEELKLCNGRIWIGPKELLKMLNLKI